MMNARSVFSIDEVHTMNMLYDSETFSVVHVDAHPVQGDDQPVTGPQMPRHGFEIVDKRSADETRILYYAFYCSVYTRL